MQFAPIKESSSAIDTCPTFFLLKLNFSLGSLDRTVTRCVLALVQKKRHGFILCCHDSKKSRNSYPYGFNIGYLYLILLRVAAYFRDRLSCVVASAIWQIMSNGNHRQTHPHLKALISKEFFFFLPLWIKNSYF